MIPSRSPVAVASRSFSRNATLRRELRGALSELRFNDTNRRAGWRRAHRVSARLPEGDHRARHSRRARVPCRARASRGQQVRRRPRHDRSGRRAQLRRVGAVDARREPTGGRRADDRVHDRAVPPASCRSPASCETAAGVSPAAGSSRRPSSASSAAVTSASRWRGCAARLARQCSRTTSASYDEFYREHEVTPVSARRAARAVGHRHAACAARCVDARPDRRARDRADEADGVPDQHRARRHRRRSRR